MIIIKHFTSSIIKDFYEGASRSSKPTRAQLPHLLLHVGWTLKGFFVNIISVIIIRVIIIVFLRWVLGRWSPRENRVWGTSINKQRYLLMPVLQGKKEGRACKHWKRKRWNQAWWSDLKSDSTITIRHHNHRDNLKRIIESAPTTPNAGGGGRKTWSNNIGSRQKKKILDQTCISFKLSYVTYCILYSWSGILPIKINV